MKLIKKSSKTKTKKIGYVVFEEDSWGKVNESIGEYGMTYSRVEPLFQFLSLSKEESAKVAGVSTRTLSRWDDQTPIGLIASERAAKIDHLVNIGIEVFKSEDVFKEWFAEKNFSLGGKSPKQMLGQPFGLDLITDTLLAVQFGNMM